MGRGHLWVLGRRDPRWVGVYWGKDEASGSPDPLEDALERGQEWGFSGEGAPLGAGGRS